MKTEEIIDDAEAGALYFRTLVTNGVPPMFAIQMASAFASARVISAAQRDKPRDPWDLPPG